MSVVRTDEWLLAAYDKPEKMCEKLTAYFDGAAASEIYEYFTLHGMYRPKQKGSGEAHLLERKVWEVLQLEEGVLKRKWRGPDIPIYIFPSDENNQLIQTQFGGKAGLAFKDKLFLFVSDQNSEQDLKALFTHEYNHVCRLHYFDKKEDMYTLLDTMLLEGLAENAVRERLGKAHIANWVSFYTKGELEELWLKRVQPKLDLLRGNREYEDILYGFRHYPKMLGYCIGYYLVEKFLEKHNVSCGDLLTIKSSIIAGLT